MTDLPTLAAAISLIVNSAPFWLTPIRDALLSKGAELAIDKGLRSGRNWLHLNEKEQLKHLELSLKNAAERGLAKFHTHEERDQYRSILQILSESNSEALRHEAMGLFTLSDHPDLKALTEKYNLSQRITALVQHKTHKEVDAVPYLSSFFEALIAALYADPFFRQQMSDVLQVRAALIAQQLFPEAVATLRQIRDAVAHDYTTEQFAQDVQTYAAHIERIFHHLKIAVIVPKDKNPDPELNGIFVPVRIALQDQTIPEEQRQASITDLLERYPYLVLLGGPGSGKSTVTRYLAWSHAHANLPNSTTSDIPLLSRNPLPLRIELRRLTQDRRQHPYNFLSYATEVLLGREGVEINPQMFKDLLEQRNMLLLFDGLDEVATLDERRGLVEEIEHFAQRYPGNHILVTSRPVGYDLARFSNQQFSHAEVQEFNDEQIRQFLERWYTHVLRLSPIRHDDQQELEALFTTLKENPRLHKLAVNPLLLTVITELNRYERLPDRRVQVYERCAELLLERWANLKGTVVRWKDIKMVKEEQAACVAHLGFILHERSQEGSNEVDSTEDIAIDVPTRFMSRAIEHFLNSRNPITEAAEQRAEAKRFLELMQVEAGLIVQRGTDESGESLYGFVHRTFQEYFAAADVYERYQQEEDPTIISEFLKEHLHDHHWREVILLLLGKLLRKPVTSQLRQILEGKINSRRSQYTDIVQQDLFFVCDCLPEVIAVESELVGVVISRLSDVVKNSPFPSQRQKALTYLGSLTQNRQFANPAQRELTDLVIKFMLDVDTRIEAAQTLYGNSPTGSEEQQQAVQALSNLAQLPDLSVEQQVQIAEALYRCSPSSPEKSQAIQMLLRLTQLLDLSIEQQVQIARAIDQCSLSSSEEKRQAIQMFSRLAQRSDLSIEQQVQIAQAFTYSLSSPTERWRQVILLLSRLIQLPDLSVEQQVQVAQALYRSRHLSSSEEWHQAIQILSRLAERPDLSVEQQVQVAQALYQCSPSSSEEERQAIQMLLRLAQLPDLSGRQLAVVAEALSRSSHSSNKEWRQTAQVLSRLAQRHDLPVKQQAQIAQALYRWNPPSSKEERQAIQILSRLAQRPDLSIEEQVQVAENLYQCSLPLSEEERQAIQMLLRLAQRPDLSIEEQVQVAENLYRCSLPLSEEERQAIQMLLRLAQLPDLSVEQQVQVAQALYRCSLPLSEKERQAIQMLLRLAQLPDLSIEQQVQVAQALYRCSPSSLEKQQAVQMLLRLAQLLGISVKQHVQIADSLQPFFLTSKERRQRVQRLLRSVQLSDLPIEQQVQIAENPYRYRFSSSKERRQIVQILLHLAERLDLSIEQQVQVAESLYQYSSPSLEGKERRQQAIQLLLRLAQLPEISVKQQVQVAEALYRCSSRSLEKEEQQQAVQMLLHLAQRPDLSVEQSMQVMAALYRSSLPASKEERQAAQMLLTLTQDQSLTINQRLQAIGLLLAATKENYSGKIQAVQTMLALLKGEAVRRYLEEHWQTTYTKKADSSEILLIFELAKKDILPTKVRDEMYQILRDMVPQFDKISTTNEQPTP